MVLFWKASWCVYLTSSKIKINLDWFMGSVKDKTCYVLRQHNNWEKEGKKHAAHTIWSDEIDNVLLQWQYFKFLMPVTASTHLGFSTYKKRASSIVVEPCKYPVMKILICSILVHIINSSTSTFSEQVNSWYLVGHNQYQDLSVC
jgi:hypothetical protein